MILGPREVSQTTLQEYVVLWISPVEVDKKMWAGLSLQHIFYSGELHIWPYYSGRP